MTQEHARSTGLSTKRELLAVSQNRSHQSLAYIAFPFHCSSDPVNELTAQVTAKLNGALVLRQQRYDRQQRLTTGGTMTAIVLALFFGGYALHAYLWRYETSSIERCMRQAVVGTDGTSYCPLSAVKSNL